MTEVLFLLELFDGGLDLGVRGGAALEEIADFAKEHDVLGRGASSPRSSKSGMNRVPSGRFRYAPSPRNASVNRKLRACGWYNAVG